MPKIDFKDYYETLGVSREADEKTLRAAFRKLARKHHPDINPGDASAEERFKEINEAYEVLSDPEKRKLYDRYGEDWRRFKEAGYTGDEPPFRTGARGGQQYEDFGSWFTGDQGQGGGFRVEYEDDAGGYSDFFQTLFGGRGRTASADYRTIRRPRRGQDLESTVTVSFDEAFRGTTRRFDIQTFDTCPTCDGAGVVRGAECPTCDGTGSVPRSKSIEVRVPPGVATGSRIRMSGQGGPGREGGPPGDIYLNVVVTPDPRFEREGDTLRTVVEVPLYTALLGGEVLVPTPSGRLALRIPPETQQGQTFRLRGQGMPKMKSKGGERGDLIARANVMLPRNLSERERALITELSEIRGSTAK